MAFKKKTWTDRMVEYAGRRKLTNVSTKQAVIYDVERSEGTVSKEGDAFSSQNMNDLEQRVADGFSEVKQTTDGLIQNLGGVKIIPEGSGANVKYYAQLGADATSKKLLGSALFGEITLPVSTNVAVSYELGFRPSKLCIMSNSETYSSSVVWRYEATRGFTEQYSYNSFDGASYAKNKWLTITDTGFTITLSGTLHRGEPACYFALQ